MHTLCKVMSSRWANVLFFAGGSTPSPVAFRLSFEVEESWWHASDFCRRPEVTRPRPLTKSFIWARCFVNVDFLHCALGIRRFRDGWDEAHQSLRMNSFISTCNCRSYLIWWGKLIVCRNDNHLIVNLSIPSFKTLNCSRLPLRDFERKRKYKKKITLRRFELGSFGFDFVPEIHAKEICNDPVRCIIPQVWISIINLLDLNEKGPRTLKQSCVLSDKRHPGFQVSDSQM